MLCAFEDNHTPSHGLDDAMRIRERLHRWVGRTRIDIEGDAATEAMTCSPRRSWPVAGRQAESGLRCASRGNSTYGRARLPNL